MRQANFYSLVLATIHMHNPVPVFAPVLLTPIGYGAPEIVGTNLTLLATALEQENPPEPLMEFVHACTEATNTKNNREIRFRCLCHAQGPELLA